MSLTLILTRHAKSSWDNPALDDLDRPLNGRGRKSAVAIGRWLHDQGYIPAEVLVSSARRTSETWARMAPDMPTSTIMRSEPALYHSGADTILGALRTGTAPVLMLIAHNPGICAFAQQIVIDPPAHERFQDYPTGATTVMTFDCRSWSEVTWHGGQVLAFVVPRELL